ncbi:hypothetical protein HMPREF9456_02772 [Dysgonomonas mossii DSM 22836]|uniref:Uncharacterized protein n=1 Tax=Dysgonomonas mossii DSM 22836 TaxID=742767 RepID=F8X3E4_9BACT|nr:hypothetical protein HMPREF9456_02772 [Dysgonomonas mossii DSM 22836]
MNFSNISETDIYIVNPKSLVAFRVLFKESVVFQFTLNCALNINLQQRAVPPFNIHFYIIATNSPFVYLTFQDFLLSG